MAIRSTSGVLDTEGTCTLVSDRNIALNCKEENVCWWHAMQVYSYFQSNFQSMQFSGHTWRRVLAVWKEVRRTGSDRRDIGGVLDRYLLKIISRAKGRRVPARADLSLFSHSGPPITFSRSPETK